MASKRVVVDASLIIDLYTAPDDMRASIAEEVLSWITTGLVEAYAPKLLMVEVLGVLARYLSDEDLELVMSSFPPIKRILLTNDRRQKQNARKVGIEAYYLIEEKEVAKQSILLSHNQHEEHK